MRPALATLLVLLLASTLAADDRDEGTLRLHRLAERSRQSRGRIIPFSQADFQLVCVHAGSTS